MQLLVSVRSGAEVEAALAGSADIIDAKEPANGSLGAVSAATLAEVAARVPAAQRLSIALGDVTTAAEVLVLMDKLELPPRASRTYLKLGFAGVESEEVVGGLIGAAVRRAERYRFPVSIIAVAYADADRATALPPETILGLAATAGADGVLMDTHLKNGPRLLDWHTAESLGRWVSSARTSGLTVGVAGSLRAEDVSAVAALAPDVIGFRGAACHAGRLGVVSAERVGLLRQCVDDAIRPQEADFAYTAHAWRNARS